MAGLPNGNGGAAERFEATDAAGGLAGSPPCQHTSLDSGSSRLLAHARTTLTWHRRRSRKRFATRCSTSERVLPPRSPSSRPRPAPGPAPQGSQPRPPPRARSARRAIAPLAARGTGRARGSTVARLFSVCFLRGWNFRTSPLPPGHRHKYSTACVLIDSSHISHTCSSRRARSCLLVFSSSC